MATTGEWALARNCQPCLVIALSLFAAPAPAYDLQPNDIAPLAPATNVIMLTYNYASAHRLTVENKASIGIGSFEDVNIGTVRLLHYDALAEVPYVLGVFQPFASEGGELLHKPLNDAAGAGDTVLVAGIWPVTRQQLGTYVGVATYTYVPDGQYSPGKTLNIGNNRWAEDMQFGMLQRLLPDLKVEVVGDFISTGNNDQAGPLGNKVLVQANSWQFQGWLSYDITAAWMIGGGYDGHWGGRQKLGGIDNGQKADETQIKGTVGYRIAPGSLVQADLYHDMSRVGGAELDRGLIALLSQRF